MKKLIRTLFLLVACAVTQAGTTHAKEPTVDETPACGCAGCECGCVDSGVCSCKDICGWYFNTNPENGELIGIVQVAFLPNGQYFVSWMRKTEIVDEKTVSTKTSVALGKRLKNVLAISWGKDKDLYLYEITSKGKSVLQIKGMGELWTPMTPPKMTMLQMETMLALSYVCFQDIAADDIKVDATLNDGSKVRIKIASSEIKLRTSFGDLLIPTKDIYRIEFGLHNPKGMCEKVAEACKSLGASGYKERITAEKDLLHFGVYSYRSLLLLRSSDNPEIAKRAQKIVERIEEAVPKNTLERKQKDVVYTKDDGVIVGEVSDDFKATSEHLGDMVVRLASLHLMTFQGTIPEAMLTLDAAVNVPSDKWMNTRVRVAPGMMMSIQCEGKIDLWPSGPGQYMCDANGHTSNGKDSTFKAGMVIGKIGEHGPHFKIGEAYKATMLAEGELYLAVVPSPWNNVSQGTFTVRVKTEYR